MKRLLSVTLVLLSLVFSSSAEPKEKLLLVKQTDHSKQESYGLMSPEEYKAEANQIKTEKRFHMKALSAAEKEWRSDEDLRKKPFPRSSIAARTIRVITTYTDSEKANDKLAYYMEKDFRAAEKRSARNKGQPAAHNADKAARAAERESLADQARQLYTSAISELEQGLAEKEEPGAAE